MPNHFNALQLTSTYFNVVQRTSTQFKPSIKNCYTFVLLIKTKKI